MPLSKNPFFSAFVLLAKVSDVLITPKQLFQDYGKAEPWDLADLIHVSKHLLDAKVGYQTCTKKRLNKQTTPFLLQRQNASGELEPCVVLQWREGEGSEGRALVQLQDGSEPMEMSLWQWMGDQNKVDVFWMANQSVADKTVDKPFGYGWFWQTLTAQRFVFWQVMLAAIFIQVFALVTPLFSMVVMDKVFSAGSLNTLDVLFIGVVIFTLFEFVLGFMRKHVLSHATTKLDVLLSARIFEKLTHLPIAFFSQRRTGDTVVRIKELESIRGFVSGQGLSTLIDFPFTLIILVVMFLFSPQMTLVAVIAMVLLFVVYGVVSPKLKDRMTQKHQMTVDNQSYLVEMVRGMDTLKSMALESQAQRRWEQQVADHSVFAEKSEGLSSDVSQIGQLISKATVALVMYLGAMGVMNGTLTPGQMIAMNMLVGRVMGPSQRIAQMLMQMHQVNLSVTRLAEILDAQEEANLHKHHQHMPPVKGQIRFDQVSFRYGDQSPMVLDNVSLDVKAGEVIGIAGASGAGKSTLMRLLLKLYLPTSGKLLIDGIPLTQYDPIWLRRHVGVVLQDNLLFNLSVRDNIAITDTTVSHDVVEHVAKLAGVDEFVHQLQQGYDTLVGEQGSVLSAGQRQRIAIARALVGDPKILILDEATSDLDSKSEQVIQTHMREMTKGRTTFVIAHRLSTLRMADRVVVLDQGRIVEVGSPTNLLAQGGAFAEFYALQQVG